MLTKARKLLASQMGEKAKYKGVFRVSIWVSPNSPEQRLDFSNGKSRVTTS